MADESPNRGTWPITQVIAAAFDEWLKTKARSKGLPMNDAELGELATLMTYKLVEAGLIDDENEDCGVL